MGIGLCLAGIVYTSRIAHSQQITVEEGMYITRIGTLQKVFEKNVDYTHILNVGDATIPVVSNSQQLDEYIGKKVAITGKYSGSMFYAEIIVVSPE